MSCKHCGSNKLFYVNHLALNLCLTCGKCDREVPGAHKDSRLLANMNPEPKKVWP